MEYTVYNLICLKNNRIYIGITRNNLQERFNQHLGSLKNNKHKNKSLQKDYNYFNLSKLDYIIIPLEKVNCSTNQEMLDCEYKWINFYKNNYFRDVYNISNIRKEKENIPEENKWESLKKDNQLYFEIWNLIKEGMRNRDIVKLLGVSNGLVSSIRNGRNWFCKYIDDFKLGIKPKKI